MGTRDRTRSLAVPEFAPGNAGGAHELAGAAVLIPAWQPEPCLPELVDVLLAAGVGAVVCVDDGSGPAFSALFESVAGRPRTVVLRHAVNRGKGRALKTGLRYIGDELAACNRIVTVDADGQHTPVDVVRVLLASGGAVATQGKGPGITLGMRSFSGKVPWRSRFGNRLTRMLFTLCTGLRLRDTQTGLRCFSRDLLPTLLALEGERYEYEMTVLARLCRQGVRPLEVQIETVYSRGNRGSHFDPVRDSLRICVALVRSVRG